MRRRWRGEKPESSNRTCGVYFTYPLRGRNSAQKPGDGLFEVVRDAYMSKHPNNFLRYTLSKISKQVYGDANEYNKIFEANRDQLSDPDNIRPGQTLKIPA